MTKSWVSVTGLMQYYQKRHFKGNRLFGCSTWQSESFRIATFKLLQDQHFKLWFMSWNIDKFRIVKFGKPPVIHQICHCFPPPNIHSTFISLHMHLVVTTSLCAYIELVICYVLCYSDVLIVNWCYILHHTTFVIFKPDVLGQ